MTFYFQVLWQRKILIILTTVAAVAVVMVGTMQSETTYTAETVLRVVPFGIEKPDYGTYVYFDQLTNTFMTIMESDAVIDAAKERLDRDRLPSWEMSKVPNTELMKISVTDKDPALAQTVANTLAEVLIEQVQSQYLSGVYSIEATLGARIDQLDEEIAELMQQQITLENAIPRDNIAVAEVTSAIDSRNAKRSGLLDSYNQALVAQTAQANTISIISEAKLPDEPSGSNRTLMLALAGAVGIVGGIAVAFIVQNIQPQLYTTRQVEQAAGFPVVGDLPPVRRKLQGDMFAQHNPGVEVLRRLRAKVLQSGVDEVGKTLLVTSADCHPTSAMVAANCAISLTTSYENVLIIDTHLQQPALAKLWGLAADSGLSHVLRNGTGVQAAIQAGPRPNLDVLVAGEPDFAAVDAIASRQFAALLADLREQYDAIVLYGAPLETYADSIVLSDYASDILLVIRKNSAEKQVQVAGQELQPVAAKVLGIVLV